MPSKKRGRPKKKAITYDSKETKFIFGLLLVAIGAFSLVSYFIPGQGIFEFFRALFGNATIIAAIFFINSALSAFGIRYFLTTRRSLFAQFLTTLLSATLFAAIASPLFLRAESYAGRFGGIIGYEIATFSKNSLLLNLTAPVAIILIIVILPALFSQNLADFFNSTVMTIDKIIGKIAGIFSGPKNDNQPGVVQNAPGPATVGGLRASMSKPIQQQPKSEENYKAPEFVGLSSQAVHTAGTRAAAVDANGNSIEDASEKYKNWKLPPSSLLNPIPKLEIPEVDIEGVRLTIEQTLNSFGIAATVVDATVGPSVTQYALDIAMGIKVQKIANLKNNLALALATSANAVRIEVPIPGTSYVGIEIPNAHRRPVFFREIIEDAAILDERLMLPVTVGKDIAGKSVVADIQRMPHLLIAGATGSGKSVLTNSFILSILMRKSPAEVRFIMVDPKQVELSDYDGIPHLLTNVITDMSEVVSALKWAVEQMEQRYTIFREAQVRNLEGYNQKMGYIAMPYIVVVIDEMADMMLTAAKVDIETNIVKLAQKARATGIHLILATQRPSVNVITGLIKANIPGRIGMSVTTGIDSRVILDSMGAESLLGKGDMLYKEPDKNKPYRVQGVFVGQEEIQRVVNFIKEQTDGVEYIAEIVKPRDTQNGGAGEVGASGSSDGMFAEALRVVVSTQKGSASLLQRRLKLGYNRAARLIDEMESMGVVGPENGSKPREVLITDAESFLQQLGM